MTPVTSLITRVDSAEALLEHEGIILSNVTINVDLRREMRTEDADVRAVSGG